MHVCFALAPDTDIGPGSDERIVYIDAGRRHPPVRRDADKLTETGIGVSAWAGGEYEHPLDPTLRLRGGADISRREYRSDEFDRMTISVHAGPRWLLDRRTDASVPASARRHWLANDPDRRDLGLRLEARRRLTARMTGNLRASWHGRRHDERIHLDGPVIDVSLGTSHVPTPTIRLDGAVGWRRERTERERFRNSKRWVRAGATAALPWGFTVGGSGTLRRTDWQGNWLPFTPDADTPRRDLTRSFHLFAHNRALTLQGFSPQVSVTQEVRTSNAQLHDYECTSGELRFVRLF